MALIRRQGSLGPLLVLVSALTMWTPQIAFAAEASGATDDGAKERVQAKFNEGSALYSAADYTGAIAAFTEALKITTAELRNADVRGALLLNLAKAHINAYEVDHSTNHLRQARSIYGRFVAEAEGQGVYSASDVSDAKVHIDSLDAQLAELAQLEAKPAAPDPVVDAVLPSTAPDLSAEIKRKRTGGIILTVLGGVSLGASVGLIVYGSTFEESYRQQIKDLGQSPDTPDNENKLADEKTRGVLVMGIGGGLTGLAGAVGLTAGIIMLVKSKKMREQGIGASLSPVLTPSYSGLSLRGRF